MGGVGDRAPRAGKSVALGGWRLVHGLGDRDASWVREALLEWETVSRKVEATSASPPRGGSFLAGTGDRPCLCLASAARSVAARSWDARLRGRQPTNPIPRQQLIELSLA